MKTKKYTFLILSLCTCFIFTFLCQSFINGCFLWNCVPERDFHILDWDVPIRFFPKDAYKSPIAPSSEGNNEIERGSQIIFWNKDNGVAMYGIGRYPTINNAIRQYEHLAKEEDKKESEFEWKIPFSRQPYKSNTADAFMITCINQQRISCNMIARYQEYIIRFYSVIDEEMTYSDFENIVVYLDEQISSRLYP